MTVNTKIEAWRIKFDHWRWHAMERISRNVYNWLIGIANQIEQYRGENNMSLPDSDQPTKRTLYRRRRAPR